ncbi:hypothetical protein Tco_0403416 [Tanacetum coccineum]
MNLILYHEGTSDLKESMGDFQDSPDDEEDTRSSHEYLNDLEEEYQARALLAKSKRFFKKGTQRFSSAKATDQTECHKCEGKVILQELLVKKLQFPHIKHPFNQNSQVRISTTKLKAYQWTFKLNTTKSKCISEQIPSQKKRILGVDQLTEDPSSSGQKDLVFVKSLADDTKVSIPGVERPWLSEAEESLVCSTPLPPLKKLDGAEPVSGPKTIKSILRSKSTFKAETLKCVIISEPSSAPAKDYGSLTHTTTNHYDIEWFKRGEALQAKKAKALKSTRVESSNANRFKTPTKRTVECSSHSNGIKSTCINMWNNQDLKWCLEMTLHAQLKVMALSNVMILVHHISYQLESFESFDDVSTSNHLKLLEFEKTIDSSEIVEALYENLFLITSDTVCSEDHGRQWGKVSPIGSLGGGIILRTYVVNPEASTLGFHRGTLFSIFSPVIVQSNRPFQTHPVVTATFSVTYIQSSRDVDLSF